MTGADYIAQVVLYDAAHRVLATPGETCEHVPAESLPWLLADGLIVPADPAEE